MPMYVNVYQSLADDGTPAACGDATVCWNLEDAIEDRDAEHRGYRYLYSVELPVMLPRPNETVDLDELLAQQRREEELEWIYERGLKWPAGAR